MKFLTRNSPASLASSWPFSPLLAGRAVIALSILTLVLLLTPYQAVFLFVVLGQGHINLTYLDHARKGRLTKTGVVLFFVALLAAFAALSLNTLLFILFVSVFFLLHNFFDDMRLLKDPNRPYALAATAPLLTFLVLASSDSLLGTALLDGAALPLFAAHILVSIAVTITGHLRPSAYLLYVVGTGFLLMGTYQIFPEIGSERLFAFIILSHYINWYWHLYKKFGPDALKERRVYVRDCVVANAFIIAAFAGFILVYGSAGAATVNPVYTLFYTPSFFYVWTLMHLLVTFRRADYGIGTMAWIGPRT